MYNKIRVINIINFYGRGNMMAEDKIQKKLEQVQFRLTRQRRAILEVMKENQGVHLSAEEVLAQARLKEPDIGIATIYRTLDKLSSLSVLYKIAFAEDKYRYELCSMEDHRHHHIVCQRCGGITEVEEDLMTALESFVEDKGFLVLDHQVIISAICPDCRKAIA